MPYSHEQMLESVLYRDADIIVVNKPAGLPVHRTPKGDENLEQYFDALRFDAAQPPLLAHRLDKETSGCLVLGRHKQVLARLGKQFADGKIRKRYLALVKGAPHEANGQISRPMRRFDLGRGKWEFRLAEDGQEAITDYETLKAGEGYTLLAMHPRTGRTHQLRIHAQALGCPILGDAFYGGAEPGVDRLFLHAESIRIPNGKETYLEVKAPLPEYFEERVGRV